MSQRMRGYGDDMDLQLEKMSALRQTAIISAVAVLLAFAITGTLHLLVLGYSPEFWNAVTFAIIVPWGIAIPVSFYLARQRESLVRLAEQLQRTEAELLKTNETLRQKADFDGMTGLPNRETFFAHLDKVRATRDSSILMIVDVDHFKNINDSFGHPVGDTALMLLSKTFRRILRKQDIIGRIGGEEFGILLPDTSEAEGQIIGEMIRHEIENTRFEPHKGLKHVMTVSIGLTGAAAHHDRPVLMRNADTALFEAKRNGRNRVVLFEPGMRSKPRPFYDAAQTAKAAFANSK